MNLAEYLKRKHLEYCNEVGDIVYESDWIKQELNPKLPPGEKFSLASFNQWMNDDRDPAGKNMARLITVFGPEVMPYLKIKIDPDLQKFINRWPDMPQEARDAALRLSEENGGQGKLAALQV